MIDVWAIGCMYYAMLYGYLPFWGESEEEFIDKICNQPLKFDQSVLVSTQCKDLLKGMLQKEPEKRIDLIELMNTDYFNYEEEELEEVIKQEETKMKSKQTQEEEKSEKQIEQDFINNLNINSQSPPNIKNVKGGTKLKDNKVSSVKQGSNQLIKPKKTNSQN